MVVAMRLMRMGTTHRPIYRISVADSRRAPTGKFIEHIGTYDPHLDKMGNKMLRLNVARAKYWIAQGCQPSSVVARLLSRFHLLPLPPQRNTVVTGPLLHKVLAGEDVRPYVPKPGEHPAEALKQPMAHEQKSNRWAKELTPERIEQVKQQAPWKLQAFPFQAAPTEATMQAWAQARQFHKHLPVVSVTQQAVLDAANWRSTPEERALFGTVEGEAVEVDEEEIDLDEDEEVELEDVDEEAPVEAEAKKADAEEAK